MPAVVHGVHDLLRPHALGLRAITTLDISQLAYADVEMMYKSYIPEEVAWDMLNFRAAQLGPLNRRIYTNAAHSAFAQLEEQSYLEAEQHMQDDEDTAAWCSRFLHMRES
jgi:hypothetical protein